MDPVFDAHLHLFSRAYYESLAAKAPGEGTVAEKITRFSGNAGIEVPPADVATLVARWLGEFDRHGVARAIAFASSAEEVDAVSQAATFANGRLVPASLVDPTAPEAPARVHDLLRKRGFRAVLLFPALHRYRVGGPEAKAVLDEVAAAKGVVYVQCGLLKVPVRDLMGIPRSIDLAYANPLDLVPVADAFPATTFVVPHFGAGFFREALMLGAQCGNVCVDTSSSNSWMAADPAVSSLVDVFRRTIRVFGPDRILFGTDSGTWPRGWRADVQSAQVRAIVEAGLPKDAFPKVFGANTARVFGLP